MAFATFSELNFSRHDLNMKLDIREKFAQLALRNLEARTCRVNTSPLIHK